MTYFFRSLVVMEKHMKKQLNLIRVFFITVISLLMMHQVAAQNPEKEIWIDVRTVKEYQREHLDGAANIPHTQIRQRIAEITDNKQAQIHLYCVSGVRAEIAKQALQSIGYENVINEGGLKDLGAN